MSILDLFSINEKTQDDRRADSQYNVGFGLENIQPKIFTAINNLSRNFNKPIGNTDLGLMNLIQAGKFFSNPTFTSGLFSPIGTLGIAGLQKLFSNIKDPYKSAFGSLNRQTKAAINREQVRDLQDRIDKGEFGSTTPTPQDDRRGGQYDGGGGGNTSGGFSSSERGAALHG